MCVHNIKHKCKREVFVRTGCSMQCAPCKSVTVCFESGLLGFHVCAEVDPTARNPGHTEGVTVCSDRPLARYDGQGPWTEQASVAAQILPVRLFANYLWFLLMLLLFRKHNPNYKLTMLFICGNFLTWWYIFMSSAVFFLFLFFLMCKRLGILGSRAQVR